MNNSETVEDSALLPVIHRDKLIAYLPVMALLVVFAVLGIVGNSITIRFYSTQRRKSSTSVFIQYLGVLDLIVCILSFNSIADLAVNVYFTSSLLCKLMYFCVHSFISASVLVLWIISIDRYLKVCRPLARQLQTTWAKPIVVVVLLFCFVVSSCDFFTYDSVQVDLKHNIKMYPNTWAVNEFASVANVSTYNSIDNGSSETVLEALYGHYCTSTEHSEILLVKKIFNAVEIIIIVMVIFTFMIAYGMILKTLLKNARRQSSHVNRDQPSFRNRNKERATFTEASISVMMAAVSLGLVLSFIPYFIIAVSRTLTNTTESELNAWHQLALRSPYLNSIINPIVFCIFNPSYRKYVMKGLIVRDPPENTISLKHVRPLNVCGDGSNVITQSTVTL